MSMDTALRDYMISELALVEQRKEAMDKKFEAAMAQMNLELGKMKGISMSLAVRRNELMEALGVKVTEEPNEPEVTE